MNNIIATAIIAALIGGVIVHMVHRPETIIRDINEEERQMIRDWPTQERLLSEYVQSNADLVAERSELWYQNATLTNNINICLDAVKDLKILEEEDAEELTNTKL